MRRLWDGKAISRQRFDEYRESLKQRWGSCNGQPATPEKEPRVGEPLVSGLTAGAVKG